MKTVKSNFNLTWVASKFKSRILLSIFLVFLIVVGVLPGYWQGGQWSWSDLAQIQNLQKRHQLKETGITIPGWEIKAQGQVPLTDKEWLVQAMAKDNREVILLLLPQTYYLDKPEVEWTDLNGLRGWKSDSYQKLKFTLSSGKTVEALFLRSWNQQKTFAAVEWYAWHSGGSFAPSNWFWADLWAQLQKRRLPWVAVCVRIPLEPLGNIETVRPLAESLAREVHTTLVENILAN
jgi:cyanoexosortase B-associated protein